MSACSSKMRILSVSTALIQKHTAFTNRQANKTIKEEKKKPKKKTEKNRKGKKKRAAERNCAQAGEHRAELGEQKHKVCS